jgi:hypothetical protein
MDDGPFESDAAWQSIPLCRRYCLVRFETLSVQTSKDGVASSGTVLWAIGFLSGTEHEVLGAWPVSESTTTRWGEVFADLQLRGVEWIGSVVGVEPTMGAAALPREDSRAVSLGTAQPAACLRAEVSRRWGAADPRCRTPMRESLRQQIVPASESAAQRMQSRASKAIARHGAFSNLEEACSFVSGDLRRAERRLVAFRTDVRAPVDSRSQHHVQRRSAAPPSRIGLS